MLLANALAAASGNGDVNPMAAVLGVIIVIVVVAVLTNMPR